MKTFSAKSSAVRAAANHFKVARNMTAVLEVATIHQDTKGDWFWKALPIKKEPKIFKTSRRIEKEAEDKRVVEGAEPTKKKEQTPPVETAKRTWKRPGAGTKTGRVWELADEFQHRALVLEAAKQEGLNPAMASQQFFRWKHAAK